jgi:hypothetical protein
MSESYPIASWAAALKGDFKHASFTSDDIPRQEAEGQVSLVNSTNLPKQGDWESLEVLGVVKEKDINDLFCEATLPSGWKKVSSDHSMWSYLKDDRGLTRASIFYKAAFYDQSAHIRVQKNRFTATPYHNKCDKDGVQYVAEDVGRGFAVKIFAPVYFATLDSVLGVVCKDRFYSKTDGILYDQSFVGESIDGTNAIKITKDDFYENYHHVEARHDLLEASDKLAKKEVLEWIRNIPEDAQWHKNFDFPEI